MTIIYLKPSATGTGLGTDWDNASTMASFAALYSASLPGDEIWLSSIGVHTKSADTDLTNANSPTAALPIKVRGMRPVGTVQGHPEKAVIKGARTTPWPQVVTGGVTTGGTLFNLTTGANHTHFQDLVIMNHDIGFKYQTAAALTGGRISDVEILNVRAGISGSSTVLRVRRVTVVGFLLYGFAHSGVSDIVVEDSDFYSLGFDDNSISTGSTGVFLDLTVSNARIRRCRSIGGYDLRGDASYWQGQGFGVEEGCDNVIFEDCYAARWPDAGWDAKASNQILRRCVAEYNMRNFRGSSPTLPNSPKIYEDCISRYPIYYGGSGSRAHLQMAAGASSSRTNVVEWRSTVGRSLFEDHDPITPIVNMTSTFSTCTITDALIRKHPDSPLSSGGGTPTFTNPLYELET